MIDTNINPPVTPSKQRSRAVRAVCVLGGIVVVGGMIAWRMAEPELPAGVTRSEYHQAAAEFRKEFGRRADPTDVLMTLARTAAGRKDAAKAIACFEQIPVTHFRHGPSARYEVGLIYSHTDQVQHAEDSFREFLGLLDRGIRLPRQQVAHSRRWLSLIYGVELRPEDRRRILQGLVEDRMADINDLKQYYFPSLLIWQTVFGSSRVRDFLKLDPNNLHLQIAEARYMIGEGRSAEARERLKVLRAANPQDLRVLAVLLECLYELNDWTAFSAEIAKAPDFSRFEPWLLTEFRGTWAIQQKNWLEAEKHYEGLLQDDPANTVCLMGLARAFAGQARTEEREAVLLRLQWAAKLRVDLAAITPDNPAGARTVARSARLLGMEDAAAIFEFFADRMPDKMSGKMP